MILALIASRLDFRLFWVAFFCFAVVLTAGLSNAVGQEAEDSQTDWDQSPQVSVALARPERFSPGGWASTIVTGRNPTDEDLEEVVSVFLADDPTMQYAKRFWLPAHSKRSTWLGIRIPSDLPPESRYLNLSMMRIDQSQGEERFGENLNGEPIGNRSLMLTTSEVNTGLSVNDATMDDVSIGGAAIGNDEFLYRLNRARDEVVQNELDLPLLEFRSHFLPPTQQPLDELDQLIIAGDQLRGDTTGIEIVRQWLFRGGRMWVMLDQTDPALVQELLGDNVRHTMIDEVQLNDFQLDVVSLGNEDPIAPEMWSSETPTHLLRTITDDDEVAYRIGNWPAASWRSVGRGEVLFTMLGLRGWMGKNGQPSDALKRLGKRFYEPRETPDDYSEAMLPILENQIGYEIPSRRLATTILGANVLIFLAAGIWWARRRALERMAVFIPISALATSGILFWIGNQHTGSVPSTVATGQMAHVLRGTEQLDLFSSHAIYSQGNNLNGLISEGPTAAFPSHPPNNRIRRIRWNDSGQSEWQGDAPPPGVVRRYKSSGIKTLEQPIRIHGTFDEQGFAASIEGIAPEDFSDPLVVSRTGPATALRLNLSDPKVSLRASNDDLLPTDQFVSGALLSEEQRLHQDFLRKVYGQNGQRPLQSEPTALLWTKPFETDLRVRESYQSAGFALLSVPIDFDVPQSGRLFRVPATFIDIDLAANDRGMSTAYNPRTGRWLAEMTSSNQTDLSFTFPKSLQLMKLTQVNVTVKASAPSRTLTAKCLVDGDVDGDLVSAFETVSPAGVTTFSIDRPEMLKRQADGGWWMQIDVSAVNAQDDPTSQEDLVTDTVVVNENGVIAPANSPTETSTWTIESVHIDAIGQIDLSPADSVLSTAAPANPQAGQL